LEKPKSTTGREGQILPQNHSPVCKPGGSTPSSVNWGKKVSGTLKGRLSELLKSAGRRDSNIRCLHSQGGEPGGATAPKSVLAMWREKKADWWRRRKTLSRLRQPKRGAAQSDGLPSVGKRHNTTRGGVSCRRGSEKGGRIERTTWGGGLSSVQEDESGTFPELSAQTRITSSADRARRRNQQREGNLKKERGKERFAKRTKKKETSGIHPGRSTA